MRTRTKVMIMEKRPINIKKTYNQGKKRNQFCQLHPFQQNVILFIFTPKYMARIKKLMDKKVSTWIKEEISSKMNFLLKKVRKIISAMIKKHNKKVKLVEFWFKEMLL